MRKKNKADMYLDVTALHEEVTGSCILCTVRYPDKSKTQFIVDCGLFQEEKYQAQNYSFPFEPKDIAFALVTHTHIDHIGRIPKLCKEGFNGKIYTSTLASQLMPIALTNTAEILSSSIQKNSKKKMLIDSSVPIFDNTKPLYDIDDVNSAMAQVVGLEYNTSFKVDEHISVKLFKNGHTLGACSILVTIKYRGQEPIYAFFTGDYNNHNTFFDVEQIPQDVLNLPINLITESTYGDTKKDIIKPVFDNLVVESMNNNETLIILVFAFGRMQEIKNRLKMLQDEGKLSKDIRIFSDGNLAHSYDDFYKLNAQHLNVKNFMPANVEIVQGYEHRNTILTDRKPKIILTTSGMGNYGPAQIYLPNYISRPKCTIIFGGYTAENTLGRKLQDVTPGELFELNGVMTYKRAKVYTTTEFSSHAKQDELLDFMRQFTNLKTILVNHGDADVKKIFAKKITEEISPKHVAILGPNHTMRVGAYGLLKSYPFNS